MLPLCFLRPLGFSNEVHALPVDRCTDSTIHSLLWSNGVEQWRNQVSGDITSDIAVDGQGNIYVGTTYNVLALSRCVGGSVSASVVMFTNTSASIGAAVRSGCNPLLLPSRRAPLTLPGVGGSLLRPTPPSPPHPYPTPDQFWGNRVAVRDQPPRAVLPSPRLPRPAVRGPSKQRRGGHRLLHRVSSTSAIAPYVVPLHPKLPVGHSSRCRFCQTSVSSERTH
jgi:hypothetical protein